MLGQPSAAILYPNGMAIKRGIVIYLYNRISCIVSLKTCTMLLPPVHGLMGLG